MLCASTIYMQTSNFIVSLLLIICYYNSMCFYQSYRAPQVPCSKSFFVIRLVQLRSGSIELDGSGHPHDHKVSILRYSSCIQSYHNGRPGLYGYTLTSRTHPYGPGFHHYHLAPGVQPHEHCLHLRTLCHYKETIQAKIWTSITNDL